MVSGAGWAVTVALDTALNEELVGRRFCPRIRK